MYADEADKVYGAGRAVRLAARGAEPFHGCSLHAGSDAAARAACCACIQECGKGIHIPGGYVRRFADNRLHLDPEERVEGAEGKDAVG